MPVPETNQQCPNRNIHIFLKFQFYLKPFVKDQDIYLLKLVGHAYTLNCNVSQIYKPKDQQQIKFALPQQPSSTILPTSRFFQEKYTVPHFLENIHNSNPHPLCNLKKFKQNYMFHIFFTTNNNANNNTNIQFQI